MIRIQNNSEETSLNTLLHNVTSEDIEVTRDNSGSSQMSSNTSPNDSGNASDLNSYLCSVSLNSAENDSLSNDCGQQCKFQHLLQEKNQSLLLALQHVRMLKSELERLGKSENWYKRELRTQRNSRMEILEKLYTNERRFTQENQRLQNECILLRAKCTDIETQLHEKNQLAKNFTKHYTFKSEEKSTESHRVRDFELDQLRQKLTDQEQLIEILRNQKRSLLSDLQRLSSEKDEIVLKLQRTIAQLEDENRTITKRYKQLTSAKIILKEELLARETELGVLSNEILDLQITVKSLQEKLNANTLELNQKEHELDSLKRELFQRKHSDQVSALIEKKHEEKLYEKEEAISHLNKVVDSLKIEISTLQDLRPQCDQQQQVIKALRQKLDESALEINENKSNHKTPITPKENLSSNCSSIAQTSSDLMKESSELCRQNVNLNKELDRVKSTLETSCYSLELEHFRKRNKELEKVSQKYIDICKIYEKSKFESDLKDITVEKLKFEKEKDKREIDILRERLVEVSKKIEFQKSLTTEFEFVLAKLQQEKRGLELQNKSGVEKCQKLRNELHHINEMFDRKEDEIKKLKGALFEINQKHKTVEESTISSFLHEKKLNQKRIEFIKSQLDAQMGRMHMLNLEQDMWEKFLTVARKDCALNEGNTDGNEFDDLNRLFDEQNLELMHLNEQYFKHMMNPHTKDGLYIPQQELGAVNSKTFDSGTETEVKDEKETAYMTGSNEHLVEEFNKDTLQEREIQGKQSNQLRRKIKLYVDKNEKLEKKVRDLQSQIKHLRVSNQEFAVNCDSEIQTNDSTKLKMSLYNVHNKSLFSKEINFKRKCKVAENGCNTLLVKSKDTIQPEEVEKNVQDTQTKFELRQEINELQDQLKIAQEQISLAIAKNTSSTMGPTNLMDDYKNLIQQSQSLTKRLSTSDIYDLIARSNNCVPKLTNINSSVNGLRVSIQQICEVVNQVVPAGKIYQGPEISLMDELKLAGNV